MLRQPAMIGPRMIRTQSMITFILIMNLFTNAIQSSIVPNSDSTGIIRNCIILPKSLAINLLIGLNGMNQSLNAWISNDPSLKDLTFRSLVY
jgi:hypothetical protein